MVLITTIMGFGIVQTQVVSMHVGTVHLYVVSAASSFKYETAISFGYTMVNGFRTLISCQEILR